MNAIQMRSVGSDCLSIEMIKAVIPFALPTIPLLINNSLENGAVLKDSIVSLVHPLGKVLGT